MNHYEHRELVGKILEPFDITRKRSTKDGWYYDFQLQTADKVQQCRLWKEVYESAQSVLEAGKKVAIFGQLRGDQLVVRTARPADAPAPKKGEQVCPVSPELRLQELKEKIRANAAKGIVAVREGPALRWYPEKYTVKDGRRRKLKIDFAMEKLGAAYVAHKMRAERFIALEKDKVRLSRGFEHFYMELLDGLVQEALKADAETF